MHHKDLAESLKRVNVVGVSGSGKSTFARELATTTDVPYIEMDQLYWKPNWQEPTTDEFRQLVAHAIDAERWILDGNYHGKTHDLKWSRATSIIWLDMSLGRTLVRAVGRAVDRSWKQTELWPGTNNRESFRRSFLSRDSILLWTLTNYRRVRQR